MGRVSDTKFDPDFLCVKMNAVFCDCCNKNNIESVAFFKKDIEFVLCKDCLKQALLYIKDLDDNLIEN